MFRRAGKLQAGCCGTRVGRRRRSICRHCLREIRSHRLRLKSSSMNVGIDLGTTNSALAFIDTKEAAEADFPTIRVLDVPQTVAQGRVEARRTLPSFLYLGDQEYVGVYAREQGALVPTKSVHSAKSWLSNPEGDRTAKILPWDAQVEGRILSPVEVSAKIVKHLTDAFAKDRASPIADHNVVLTVPASF